MADIQKKKKENLKEREKTVLCLGGTQSPQRRLAYGVEI